MIIGVPKEIKDNEARVGVTPAGVKALTEAGHTVLVETRPARNPAFPTRSTRMPARRLWARPADVWGKAETVVKVKEPIEQEYAFFREGLVLFTYLHLAPLPELTEKLLDARVIGIAYETVRDRQGTLPLLTPMSEVAGRMSVQVGAAYLEKEHGGRGILLGGVPGVPPAHVTIIGGGVVGTNAAKIALGLGAKTTIVDVNLNRLRELDDHFGGRLGTLASNSYNLAHATREADLVIGGVLIPGATAPRIVTRAMVAADEEGRGDCGRGHRPGRLRGDGQAHFALQPELCGGWRGALLRHQYARRGAAHLDTGADQLDLPLSAAHCQPGRARGAAPGCGPGRGAEHLAGQAHLPRRGREPAAAVDAGCRGDRVTTKPSTRQVAEKLIANLPCISSSPALPTPLEMKLCPIHRTYLFLSDGWESAEHHDDVFVLSNSHFCFSLGHDFTACGKTLVGR